MSDDLKREVGFAMGADGDVDDIRAFGDPSLFTCPDCHGAMVRLRDATPPRFRCHTGHAFTALSLEAELAERIEASAWNTIRSLEEHVMLLNQMAEQSNGAPPEDVARLRARAEHARRRAALVRAALAEDAPDAHE